MAFLTKGLDLLIGQWRASPTITGLIRIFEGYAREEVEKPLETLALYRTIDGAEGVWLDRLGHRLGMPRPYTTEAGVDPRLAFEGVTGATGFDQAPFAGNVENEQTFPLGDALYRRFLKARAIVLLADGSFFLLCKAVWLVDPGATLRDNLDMSVRVNTDKRWVIELADSSRALPRAAGVMLDIREREIFGFDDSGVSFDQGAFL